MENGTKVKVDLSAEDARNLGLAQAYVGDGEIAGKFENGVDGHYVRIQGKKLAIADKYKAVEEIGV